MSTLVFNYSEAQWDAIEKAFGKLLPNRLSEKERDSLQLGGCIYLWLVRRCSKPARTRALNAWKALLKISRKTRELAVTLEEATQFCSPHLYWLKGNSWPDNFIDIVHDLGAEAMRTLQYEAFLGVERDESEHVAPAPLRGIREVIPLAEVLYNLKHWSETTRFQAGLLDRGLSFEGVPIGLKAPENFPRKFFYKFILRSWREAGGSLATSRNAKTGVVAGPLVRFFQAMAGPVMGDQAPGPEAIRDIVDRYKDEIERIPRDDAPWALEVQVTLDAHDATLD